MSPADGVERMSFQRRAARPACPRRSFRKKTKARAFPLRAGAKTPWSARQRAFVHRAAAACFERPVGLSPSGMVLPESRQNGRGVLPAGEERLPEGNRSPFRQPRPVLSIFFAEKRRLRFMRAALLAHEKSSRRRGSFLSMVEAAQGEKRVSPGNLRGIRERRCAASGRWRPTPCRPTRSGRPAGRCRRGSSDRPQAGRRVPR